MELPNTFIFVRHGETDWNLQNKFQGQIDIPLNSTGKDQAIAASQILAKRDIISIFCSPLVRANETATIFAERLALKVALKVIPELAECTSETTARLIYNGLGRTQFTSFSKISDTTETPELFIQRVERGLNRIFRDTKLTNPLIVAHGGTYWAICQLLSTSPKDIPNCLPIKFEKQGINWTHESIWV